MRPRCIRQQWPHQVQGAPCSTIQSRDGDDSRDSSQVRPQPAAELLWSWQWFRHTVSSETRGSGPSPTQHCPEAAAKFATEWL